MLGAGMLKAAGLQWRTAIDRGYVDARTWELCPHLYRLKHNNSLSGGFSGDFTPADLEELREFWTSDAPNKLLPEGYRSLGWREWRRAIMAMKVQRGQSRIPARKIPKGLPPESVWIHPLALQRIRKHPEAPPSTRLVYVALAEMQGGENKTGKNPDLKTRAADIAEVAGMDERTTRIALQFLSELQLIAVRRIRYGLEVRLLHVS